jgi:hypothetical protein
LPARIPPSPPQPAENPPPIGLYLDRVSTISETTFARKSVRQARVGAPVSCQHRIVTTS